MVPNATGAGPGALVGGRRSAAIGESLAAGAAPAPRGEAVTWAWTVAIVGGILAALGAYFVAALWLYLRDVWRERRL